MSCSVAGNRTASHNGYTGEAYVSLKYGLSINPLGRIDSQDPPVEVKSCQVQITDRSRAPYTRKGRYTLRKSQHDYLRSAGGHYIFLLLQGGEVLKDQLLSPDEVDEILGSPVTKDRAMRYDVIMGVL